MELVVTPEGIDPMLACRVEVSVGSYMTVIDGKRMYERASTVGWVVNSDEYSILDLEAYIAKHYKWADFQVANFSYVGRDGQSVRLTKDAELLEVLRAGGIAKFSMIVDNPVAAAEIQTQSESQIVNETHVFDGVNEMAFVVGGDGGVVGDIVNLEFADQPLYGKTVAGPPRVEELEEECYMERGVDPNGDEPTGADEEWRYFKGGKKGSKERQVSGQGESSHDQGRKEKCGQREGSRIEDYDPDCVPSDEAVIINNAIAAHTSYDRDKPIITAGCTFVDKEAFLLTIKQHAIKEEFETNITHSDPDRYRARCVKAPECKWRVHAKRLYASCTFMIPDMFEAFI